ncbi:MAG: holo-ACP synthase [Treponema sp.]|jgi:holo-[acyl-carrier protein] synthase|nr:holo-ACP synthase [Treponema sp.]
MITGIGIDIVHIKRMERWLIDSKLMERFFHPQEIAIIASRGKSASQSLAAKFAAKEAFGKALGTGLANIKLKDIMVNNTFNGKPEIKMFGTALKAFSLSGADKVHVSLTHETEKAIAMVVLEKV